MNKIIYCGECEKFAYEDTDGYGFCLKTNEECPKRHECKRYTTYKQDKSLFNYVMKGCIDGTLFIKET